MPARRDISGMRFNRLIALSVNNKNKRGYYWLCKCDCGKTTVVLVSKLINGHTKSCGCWLTEARYTAFRKHGLKRSPEYNSWCAMKQRCYYKANSRYSYYGGIGITVCDRWRKDFLTFLADMGKRPTKDHTLERLDYNKNYEPSNCIWLHKSKQPRNTRSNIIVTIDGVSRCLAEWCEIFGGASHGAVLSRYHRGWAINEDLFKIHPIGVRYSNLKKNHQ